MSSRRLFLFSSAAAVLLAACPAFANSGFNNRAAAIAATIPAGELAIHVMGYSIPGIGSAVYREVPDSGTLEPWQFRSNGNTRRWELSEPVVNELMLGADPTFTNDSTAAIQATMDFVAEKGAGFRSAPGKYKISSMIVALPGPVDGGGANHYYRGPTWTFDNNSTYVATASMTALFKFGNDDSNYEHLISNGLVQGGVFDCNNFAQSCIWMAWCNKCTVRDTEVRNMAAGVPIGIKFGSASGIKSYEGFAQNNRIIGSLPLATAKADSRGISFINCGDNQTRDNVIGGVLFGIRADSESGWDGKHSNNHFWSWSENGPITFAYDLYGDNWIDGTQVDGPFWYTSRFRGPRNHVVGMKVNYGSQPADQDLLASLFRLEEAGEVTVTNSGFKATQAKRIATEVSRGAGVPASAYRKDGSNYYLNVLGLAPINI